MGLPDLKAIGLDLLNILKPGKRTKLQTLQDQTAQLSSAMDTLQSEVTLISSTLRGNESRLQTIESNTTALRELSRQRPPALLPFCVFVVLICTFAITGFLYRPSGEAEAEMGGQFRVGLPYIVRDAEGIVQIKTVGWAETHGQELPFLSQTLSPVPKIENGHTGILLVTQFTRKVVSDVAIDLAIELPNGATFNRCDRQFNSQKPPVCNVADLSKEEIASGSSDRVIKVAGLIGKGSDYFGMYVDIRDADGINFVETRTRVNARFPTLRPMATHGTREEIDTWYLGIPDIELGTGVVLADADQVSWSDRPSELTDSYAGWRVTTPAFGAPPGMVSGVKDQILREDADSNFWAGLWFGLAGAAALAAIEIAVAWWRQRDRL